MIFEVEVTREAGWKLPRFRSCMYRPVRGNVVVREEHDEHLSRTVLVARILNAGSEQIEGAPVMFDVRLVCIRTDCQVLTGTERVIDPLKGRVHEYAQSWIVRPAEPDITQSQAAPAD